MFNSVVTVEYEALEVRWRGRPVTWIDGYVRLLSVLCSPGMLPAERPSHLYLNRIPLCRGCSIISTYGLYAPENFKRDTAMSEIIIAITDFNDLGFFF